MYIIRYAVLALGERRSVNNAIQPPAFFRGEFEEGSKLQLFQRESEHSPTVRSRAPSPARKIVVEDWSYTLESLFERNESPDIEVMVFGEEQRKE